MHEFIEAVKNQMSFLYWAECTEGLQCFLRRMESRLKEDLQVALHTYRATVGTEASFLPWEDEEEDLEETWMSSPDTTDDESDGV